MTFYTNSGTSQSVTRSHWIFRNGLGRTTLIGFLLVASSCGIFGSDDDPDDHMEGISMEIREFVDEDLLSLLEDSLSIPIHRGDNPPNIAALMGGSGKVTIGHGSAELAEQIGVSVVMSPLILRETIVPNDRCADNACTFNDLFVRLSNQDMTTNEIDFNARHAHAPAHEGSGSYIIGQDDGFTLFTKQIQELEEGRFVIVVSMFSGLVTSEGIAEPHLGSSMIDNAGFDHLIPNGTAHGYADGNDFAELADWPEDPEDKIARNTSRETAQTLLHLSN